MSSAADPVLQIRGLTKAFRGHLSLGRRMVLRGVDLSVRRGEVYGFLGINGAGKTTTLRIVAGLIFADAGDVSLLGRPGSDPEVRRRVGFLPESPTFHGHLTGAEFLEFQARLAGVPAAGRRAEVERLLAEVGMRGREGILIKRCSKGMLQRLGLAQAMLGAPELLILDEPMSGLDPAGRRDVRDIILRLRDRGVTILLSSHILSDAEALCDRVGILHEGRLTIEGSLDDLLGGAEPAWEVAVAGDPGAETGERRGDRTLIRVAGQEALEALLGRLLAARVRLVSVTPRRPSLEDRFMAALREEGR